jgi:hypothetical protein
VEASLDLVGREVAATAESARALDEALRGGDTDDDEIDSIYAKFDALLRDERFAEVGGLLACVDVASLTVVHMLALISITYAARDKLPGRAAFVARARQRIADVDPGRVEGLLAGFDEEAERLQLAKHRWAAGLPSRVAAMRAALSLEPEQDAPTPPTDTP